MILRYSNEWPQKYQNESDLIKQIFESDIIDIQHIGSTAVPGLTSKPIIDIAVMVDSIEDRDYFLSKLKEIDYEYKEELSSPERAFFRKGSPVEYHLSITSSRYSFWERQIEFRDFLISKPDYRDEYGKIKTEAVDGLGQKDMNDLSLSDSYNLKKGPFIESVLKRIQDSK
jgi:GrpB-like predicted nucleotidyltransferase (UPF0157 family)